MHNKIATALYTVSAVLPPLVFLVADTPSWHFYWLAPQFALAFSLVSVALAGAQAVFEKATFSDVAAAGLWFMICMSLTLPYSVATVVQVAFAQIAVLVAAAVVLSVRAVHVGLGRGGMKCVPDMARRLNGLGIGLLALYLIRGAMLIASSFTWTTSGGITEIVYEGRLRLLVASMVAAMLLAGAVIAHLACRKTDRQKA